jgi:hypothetical protein
MRAKIGAWILPVLLSATVAPALAALGGDAISVETDRVQMKAQSRTLAARSYTVHELATEAGTQVREYISQDGKVFAVAWRGPQMPDLKQLFGVHFSTFQQEAGASRRGRGPLRINEPGLVVQSGGHMRSFGGRAYLPQMIPAGVSIDEIK